MKGSDLIGKTRDELAGQLVALQKEQFNLRFQKATGQLENTTRVRVVRRDIARIATALTLSADGATAGAATPKAPTRKRAVAKATDAPKARAKKAVKKTGAAKSAKTAIKTKAPKPRAEKPVAKKRSGEKPAVVRKTQSGRKS
jgi:large subunit ribosomal protein L29